MGRLLASAGLAFAGFALSDPVPCHGDACLVEDDQAAMLQSSFLRKGETSDGMVAEESGRRRRRGKKSWGREVERTYCSNSYDAQNSKRAAKRACRKDEACGGIYQPENDPGKWFLCKGFNTYSCNSNSVVIEKLSSSSPSPSPSSPSYNDDRRRPGRYPSPAPSPSPSYNDDRRRPGRYPSPSPSASCWGSEQAGYCSGSHGGPLSQSDAETACMSDGQCGGIYQPGAEPGQWYLCKDFNVYASSSGSKSVKKESSGVIT